MSGAPQPRQARREYLLALVGLAAGGLLGLGAASRPWGSVRPPSSLGGTVAHASGSDLLPLLPAASLVAVAAVVAVPALRGVGRRVVGAVLALLGAAMAGLSLVVALDLDSWLQTWILRGPGITESSAEVVETQPAWPLAAAAASLVVLAAGVLVAVRGPAWPGLSSKYERGQAAAGEADEPDAQTPRDAWDALDRGEDPTAERS